MKENKKILYPNQLLEEMSVEGTIFPDNTSEVGVATLSQELDTAHILRIYQLIFNNEQESYEVVQELAAFTFANRQALVEFLDELPHINGLEMLMLLNPLNGNNTDNALMN